MAKKPAPPQNFNEEYGSVAEETAAKAKSLANTMAQIDKNFGKGSIMRLGENAKMEVQVISTGCLSLDLALGVGGLPRGRVVEIYGPEAGGKTTVSLHVVAQAQKNGATCAFIDAEHALDPVYAKALGVNINELLVSQPDNGEQALEITELLVRSNAVDVIVIDSVAALVTTAEIEGDMGSSLPGVQARLMSQALRKLTPIVNKSNTIIIFINQVREKIGVMYGNPETTTGGRALKFYASVRLDVRRIGQPIKSGNDLIGNNVKIKVVKNKVAPPFRETEVQIYFGKGIDQINDMVSMAVELDVVNKSGSWFSYNGERIGQGKEKVVDFLKERPELFEEIRNRVLDMVKAGKADSAIKVSPETDDEDSDSDGGDE
jgi:recombination protein RecA